MDRTVEPVGRGQDILLRTAGASEHFQGAQVLSERGQDPRDTHQSGRWTTQHPQFPTSISHQENQPQKTERTDPLQRLFVQTHVQVQIHRTAGHRRGHNAHRGHDVEGTDGQNLAQGLENQQRGTSQLQRPQRLLLRRPAAQSRMVQRDPQIHAHVTARLQGEKLHETRSVRQVFPQHRKSTHPTQPLSALLFGLRLHVLSDRHDGRAAAPLQSRLRKNFEKELRRIQKDERDGHDDMEIQRTVGGTRHQYLEKFRLFLIGRYKRK